LRGGAVNFRRGEYSKKTVTLRLRVGWLRPTQEWSPSGESPKGLKRGDGGGKGKVTTEGWKRWWSNAKRRETRKHQDAKKNGDAIRERGEKE